MLDFCGVGISEKQHNGKINMETMLILIV